MYSLCNVNSEKKNCFMNRFSSNWHYKKFLSTKKSHLKLTHMWKAHGKLSSFERCQPFAVVETRESRLSRKLFSHQKYRGWFYKHLCLQYEMQTIHFEPISYRALEKSSLTAAFLLSCCRKRLFHGTSEERLDRWFAIKKSREKRDWKWSLFSMLSFFYHTRKLSKKIEKNQITFWGTSQCNQYLQLHSLYVVTN